MGKGRKFRGVRGACARALLFVFAPLSLASCMINSDKALPKGASSGVVKALPFAAGPHPAMPTVTKGTGPVMVNPKVQMIYFPGETNATDLNAFNTKYVPASIWMSSVGTEYGIGQGSVNAPITLAANPPAATMDDELDIQPFLAAKFADVTLPIGAADENTIYVLKFRPAVTINLSGATSCVDFEGYHNWYNDAGTGKTIIYAVIPECQSGGVTSLDDLTQTISHELVEAASDPYVGSNQEGFDQLTTDFIAWSSTWGPELGDMCEGLADSFVPSSSSNIGYGFQKMWSNVQAAAGNDPCIASSAKKTYWQSVPVLTDTVGFNDWGDGNVPAHIQRVKGLKIAPGGTGTVELDLYSNQFTSAWSVSLYENPTDGNSHISNVTMDRDSGANAARLHMTITVSGYDPGWNAVLVDLHSDLNGVSKKFPFIIGQ